MFDLNQIVRPNIARLKPYSSARSEFEGEAEIFLDANENAFGSPAGQGYNRYPDPLQRELKERVAEMRTVRLENIFIGNGSDEAIDLLFRVFCEPGRDKCIICPPTYGMYRVSAEINDVAISEVPLRGDFSLDADAVIGSVGPRAKLIFICSPNNPTGNLVDRDDIVRIAKSFNGIVVVDEAYAEFADAESLISEISRQPNVVVLRTFSKAWGMAGLRVGMAFADAAIIELMNRVKPPYNVSGIAQRAVLNALASADQIASWVTETVRERARLADELSRLSIVETIYPSDANFLLVRTTDMTQIYRELLSSGIVVRDRSRVLLCEGCLRITVGTPEENDRLMNALRSIEAAASADEVVPILLGGL
ncbi:MAG: histidinol-phosphate transaminase [Acidobacteria bacterium]|nr:histidinol-phosphate transaminase [Acidobacteriota bacterium]